jgi:hypothetical protein
MICPVVWCTPNQVTEERMVGTAMSGGAGGTGVGGGVVAMTSDWEPHAEEPAHPVRVRVIWSPSSVTVTVPHWPRSAW